MPEIAFVTCARLPDLDSDDRLVIGPLAERGITLTPVVWDDRGVDWDRFDLTVIRSTWDYTNRREAFVAWARSVPRLHNPAPIVAWNTDKRYLADLAADGLPVVPTTWIGPGEGGALPRSGDYVLKPSIGAGSLDAERFDLTDAAARGAAADHADRLLTGGHTVMVQPYARGIEESGETAVILIGGEFSHAIRKSPMLVAAKPLDAVEGLYKEERIDARAPSDAEVRLARAAVAAPAVATLTGGEPLLYARVDMVPGADGRPMLMELELTEPSLFMVTAPETATTFADAIVREIERGRARAPARRARPQQEREVS